MQHATTHFHSTLPSTAALLRCLWQSGAEQSRARPALNLLRAIQLSGISFQFNNLEIVAATEAPATATAAATAVVATIAANYCIAICQSLSNSFTHSVSQSLSQSVTASICHQSSMLVASTSSTHLTESPSSSPLPFSASLKPSLQIIFCWAASKLVRGGGVNHRFAIAQNKLMANTKNVCHSRKNNVLS